MLSIRKIGDIGRTYRHLNRYRQILTIFFKYGFGDILDMLNLENSLKIISGRRGVRLERHTRAERTRMALAELGPTFIKLGQILATRPDLIPVEFIPELAKLQDDVPAVGFDQIRDTIEKELGAPLEALFDEFKPTPIASASIGQVHRAVLPDQTVIAVKVQRPDIHKTIAVDLEIMLHLASLVQRHIEELSLHRPVRIVEEFARVLGKELDYTIEADNMVRFARLFADDESVHVPVVHRQNSTSRILAMEFIEGIKVSRVQSLIDSGQDCKQITARGADLILKQVFQHGYFHADPHPGNIFVLPDNVICLLDFGMMGAVDRRTREDFVDLVDSMVHQDQSQTTLMLLKITECDQEPDIRRLEKDVTEFMGRYLYKPLKEIEIAKLLHHILELAGRHRLRIPADIFLMLKALSTVESVASTLDPEFDMLARSAPFIEKVKLARYYPDRLADEGLKIMRGFLAFVQDFPRDVLELTQMARRGQIGLQLEHKGLESILATHDQISNRISFSIIIAALIIGSALIVISEIPPLLFGISLIGIILFSAAAMMGIWLLIAILKKGRL